MILRRLLDVVVPRQNSETYQFGTVRANFVASQTSHFALREAAEGDQEELEAVLRPIREQRSHAAIEGFQGTGRKTSRLNGEIQSVQGSTD